MLAFERALALVEYRGRDPHGRLEMQFTTSDGTLQQYRITWIGTEINTKDRKSRAYCMFEFLRGTKYVCVFEGALHIYETYCKVYDKFLKFWNELYFLNDNDGKTLNTWIGSARESAWERHWLRGVMTFIDKGKSWKFDQSDFAKRNTCYFGLDEKRTYLRFYQEYLPETVKELQQINKVEITDYPYKKMVLTDISNKTYELSFYVHDSMFERLCRWFEIIRDVVESVEIIFDIEGLREKTKKARPMKPETAPAPNATTLKSAIYALWRTKGMPVEDFRDDYTLDYLKKWCIQYALITLLEEKKRWPYFGLLAERLEKYGLTTHARGERIDATIYDNILWQYKSKLLDVANELTRYFGWLDIEELKKLREKVRPMPVNPETAPTGAEPDASIQPAGGNATGVIPATTKSMIYTLWSTEEIPTEKALDYVQKRKDEEPQLDDEDDYIDYTIDYLKEWSIKHALEENQQLPDLETLAERLMRYGLTYDLDERIDPMSYDSVLQNPRSAETLAKYWKWDIEKLRRNAM